MSDGGSHIILLDISEMADKARADVPKGGGCKQSYQRFLRFGKY